MPIYHKLGNIPHKRHTIFKSPQGNFYYEQLFGTEGFNGHSSLLYHLQRPTQLKEILKSYSVQPKIAIDKNIKSLLLKGFDIKPTADFLESRKTLLLNGDCQIGLAAPTESLTKYFYKNADADEMIFIHEGSGTLKTWYGKIDFGYGDYVVIPRGTIYQIQFNTASNRLLIVESFSPLETCKRYRNHYGQLLEHAPYCERDFRAPKDLETHDEKGDFKILIKKQGIIYPFIYAYHPFDVIGWDGYHYPWAFSIHDFEPITGRVHMPPPIHQTFEARNFVVCSFVPRMYDYHPQAVPVPYNHSNIDSDEVLYYVDGEFMSRKHVTRGLITLHPGGIPHGPHPGTVEKSLGQKETKELAVMVDTFRPLWLTEDAMKIINPDYHKSWIE